VGRPFKGDVEEFTKEPHVPERRSILRGFKKFFAKKEFEEIYKVWLRVKNGELDSMNASYMSEIYLGLASTDMKNVQNYMDICRNTQSADHFRKKMGIH